VHVDALESKLLAETGTWVVHAPRSNMNSAVGAAPVESLMRSGARVCLGTDGLPGGVWDEWRAAYFLHKATSRDPRRLGGAEVWRMAVQNNAALASLFFPEAPVGHIAEGAVADLMLVDYRSPTPVTEENIEQHVIFGFQPAMVTTTIAAGKVLMRDRQLLTLDEDKIAARSRELAKRVWKRWEDMPRR
jgi:cytosine/adenosine deaminase-related metal-dependent hydrolase